MLHLLPVSSKELVADILIKSLHPWTFQHSTAQAWHD